MTDSLDLYMTTHQDIDSDHYDSDDEIYEAVKDANKHIRYNKNKLEIIDTVEQEKENEKERLEIEKEHRDFIKRDRLDDAIDNAYYEVLEYTKSLGLPLLDTCSLSSFRELYM